MNRTIPFALSLALIGTAAVWAEDQAQSAQQDQSQSQSDAAAGAAGQDRAAGAAAQDESSATATEDQAQPAAGRQAGEQDPTKMFIKDMYSQNLYEIQLAQLAQKQAQDPEAKRLAQMIIEDHTKANQQLKQIAQSAQVQVEERLDPVHQAKLQKHQQCPPSEFSRKFANDQVAGHTIAILELTYQVNKGQNEQVKQFATQQLPKMEQHLKHATEMAMAQAGGGQARQASERQPGDASQPQQGEDAPGQKSTTDAPGTPGQTGSDASGTSGKDAGGQQ
jgi:putative membrane protein